MTAPPPSQHPFAADHLFFGHREGGLCVRVRVCVCVCVYEIHESLNVLSSRLVGFFLEPGDVLVLCTSPMSPSPVLRLIEEAALIKFGCTGCLQLLPEVRGQRSTSVAA